MASRRYTLPRHLPLIFLENKVLLPGSSTRLSVKDAKSIRMISARILNRDSLRSAVIGVVPRTVSPEELSETGLHNLTGVAAVVVQVTGTSWPRPHYTLLVTGLGRFRVNSLVQEEPYIMAEVTQLDTMSEQETELKRNHELLKLAASLRECINELIELMDIRIPTVAKLKSMLNDIPDQNLPDTLASIVNASFEEKLDILNSVDLIERFQKAVPLVKRQLESLKILQSNKRHPTDLSNSLRVKVLPKKGGGLPRLLDLRNSNSENDEESDEINDLENKIKKAGLPDQAYKVAMKELKRLKKLPPQFPEHATSRNYLEWMVDLPWNKFTDDRLDVKQARQDLDEDHYGMEKVKRRVLEYLAVRQLKNSLKGPILCFVGPPGVGKTSIAKSIANTMGREFHRMSLGGIHDQSDIRGHRKTYIGAMPGRILNALKTVAVTNPVILLDEIDKLGQASLHGDPAAALLEVLDPEQNNSFVDHYLNVPFDLSQVLFIATANTTNTIPAALLDRMEIINVPGYTQEEKVAIATRYLVPKQLEEHGLSEQSVLFPETILTLIVSKYTREAGVRSLERKLGAICRGIAIKIADVGEKTENSFMVDEVMVEDMLGSPIYESELAERLSIPGVSIGLAWTVNGGEIMFVEATRMGGDGQLILTGQLGDVMKESGQLALNWVRSHAVELGLATEPDTDLMFNTDVHIHFPAGAVGKDGPSAGVTITTVLVSLFSGRLVRSDTAMTGEITLRGLVLPVGGIKDKVLAAHRAGIKRVILPKRNQKDIQEIPENVKEAMSFIFVSKVAELLQVAFDGGFPMLLHEAIRSKM